MVGVHFRDRLCGVQARFLDGVKGVGQFLLYVEDIPLVGRYHGEGGKDGRILLFAEQVCVVGPPETTSTCVLEGRGR